MSQPPDAPDPYRTPDPQGPPQGPYTPPPAPQDPYGQAPQPYGQPYPQQPYPPQPYQQEPYPQQSSGTDMPAYQAQGYGTSQPQGAWGGRDPRSQAEVRADKPPTVRRLIQAMLAGAVLTVLSSAYAVLTLDSVVASVLPDLEQIAVDLQMDTASLVEMTTTFGAVAIVVGALFGTALWLLFAWLFGRGQARVLGTVLGGINLLSSLFGLVEAVDAIDLALRLLSLGVIVAALVLLWLPGSSAWFRAVKDAGRQAPWA